MNHGSLFMSSGAVRADDGRVLVAGNAYSPSCVFQPAFSTAGTGGFSVLNNSIAGYNNLTAEIIITVFMMLFGVNFSVFFLLLSPLEYSITSDTFCLFL